jgi:hypothetical protein
LRGRRFCGEASRAPRRMRRTVLRLTGRCSSVCYPPTLEGLRKDGARSGSARLK